MKTMTIADNGTPVKITYRKPYDTNLTTIYGYALWGLDSRGGFIGARADFVGRDSLANYIYENEHTRAVAYCSMGAISDYYKSSTITAMDKDAFVAEMPTETAKTLKPFITGEADYIFRKGAPLLNANHAFYGTGTFYTIKDVKVNTPYVLGSYRLFLPPLDTFPTEGMNESREVPNKVEVEGVTYQFIETQYGCFCVTPKGADCTIKTKTAYNDLRGKEHLQNPQWEFHGDSCTLKGTKVHHVTSVLFAELPKGDKSVIRTTATKALETSFAEGNVLKEGVTVDPKFVLLAGALFMAEEDNYMRIPRDSAAEYLGLSLCRTCMVWEPVESLKKFKDGFYCAEHAKAFEQHCSICKAEFYEASPIYLDGKRDKMVCNPCFMVNCYECSHHSDAVIHKLDHKCKTATVVHDYSYAPKNIRFVGKGKYPFHMGFELEIHAVEPQSVASFIRRRLPGNVFFKRDGSIVGGGVEIVSAPHSREALLDIDFSFLVKEFGETVGAEGKGGIHVHVDRTAFTHPQLLAILSFMQNNQAFVNRIAGREPNQYCKTTNPSEYASVTSLPTWKGTDKYRALNFKKDKTLEYRLFDSTLDYVKFQKNFDWITAMWEFANEAPQDLTEKSFLDFTESKKGSFEFLCKFLSPETKKKGKKA